jgi:uncharacterized protein YbjT (DUF2867 family)
VSSAAAAKPACASSTATTAPFRGDDNNKHRKTTTEEVLMYAVTGITGKVGSAVAGALLDAGLPVRAVVRDEEKGKPWAAKGCAIAIASVGDADALTKAFSETNGVFLMTPPDFDPEPGFPETRANAVAIKAAIEAARPAKVVFLSTVGAQVSEPNLLNNSKITEEMLRTVSVPVAFLRAAWFMENVAWDVEAARSGVIPSFLQPLDHAIPMVATADIGRTAAELLRDRWSRVRLVELEGAGVIPPVTSGPRLLPPSAATCGWTPSRATPGRHSFARRA